MEAGTIFFIGLSIVFCVIIFGLNIVNAYYTPVSLHKKEGFTSKDTIPSQIRAVLDPMNIEDICNIYSVIREFMKKNEIALSHVSESEAILRVEKALAIKIPGGPLSCPLLKYPVEGATVDDWIAFLQTVPVDFGSRVVFMILYAKKELKRRVDNINAALKAEPTKTDAEFDKMDQAIVMAGGNIYENFTGLFPPTVADTRSMEKSSRVLDRFKDIATKSLTDEIIVKKKNDQALVTKLLDAIINTRNTTLSGKGISPTIDLAPYLASAKESINIIAEKQQKINDGSIVHDVNIGSAM